MVKRIKDDIVMGEGGIIAEIDAMQFIKVIGGPLPYVLQKNEKSHEVIASLARVWQTDDSLEKNCRIKERADLRR